MKLSVSKEEGKAGSVQVSDAVFANPYNQSLIHQVVMAYMAKARAGTHATKSRAAVRGGGAKPWRQKGTGRARAGTSSSPIWRGGGMTFAKTPRSYAQKVNKKMYRAAMRSMWSELIRQERLVIVETLELGEIKTKVLLDKLKKLSAPGALIVTEEEDNKLVLSARNLPHVEVCAANNVTPLGLIAHEKIVVLSQALKKIEAQLS